MLEGNNQDGELEGYRARCYACRESIPIRDLLKIKDKENDIHFYWLCTHCNMAYYYGGYNTEQMIYDDLKKHDRRNNPDKFKTELDDKRRRIKDPITLEEQAELCWNLSYNKQEVFNKLEESIKKDTEGRKD